MGKILKRILTAVISFALMLLTVVAGIFPATISVLAEERVTYEQTNVMDDLKGAKVNGKAFSLTEYSFDTAKETQVISFVEYCYSFYQNLQDNYGLYVYVYNPKGLQFVVDHELNQIQLTYGLSTSQNYEKYQLAFLNCSTETNYEGLFYKFKVVLSNEQQKRMLQALNSTDRVYRVSGIELLEQGKTNATEYTVATTYHFSGYAAGYGNDPNAGTTLKSHSEQGETLTLNVHPTVYRPSGTNGKNDYTQDSLHSVYFAVPNAVIKKYGKMSAVHATWKDAVLKPTVVTGNSDAYNAILPFLGKDIGVETEDLEYGYIGGYFSGTSGTTGNLQSITKAGYTYNRDFNPTHDLYGDAIKTLYMMFLSSDEIDSADNHTVSSEEIIEKLIESKEKYGGVLVNGKYSSDLFESVADNFTDVNIKADEQYSLTSEAISYKWWDLLFHTGGSMQTTTFDGIQAIYPVKESDMEGTAEEVSDRLYIAKSDYTDFKEYYNANKNLCTVYLFRYQVSDYIAQEATLFKKGKFLGMETWEKVDTNAYFFQETVNLDFDIIDVTFSSESVDTVIPVVSNPIDVVPDATPPVHTQSDKESYAWLLILGIGLLIVLFICFPELLPIVIKGVIGFIRRLIKGIGKLFQKKDGE